MSARLAYLAVEAAAAGNAVEQSLYRHTHLVDEPLGIVLFHPAAEPFAPAAIAYGTSIGDRHNAVCRDPRNREMLFASLTPFAEWFNTMFELPGASREANKQGDEIATGIPQVIVPNPGTWTALGLLGRRLAYLSAPEGETPPQQLVTLGQHHQFLVRHDMDGQQITVPMTSLLNDHWATPLSDEESLSLPALDAWVAPPKGGNGWDTAWEAETLPMGPLASAESDSDLDALLRARRDETEGSSKAKALDRKVDGLLTGWLDDPWDLLWSTWQRERKHDEAHHVEGRVVTDAEAYTNHLNWQTRAGGRRRTRATARQAAVTRNDYERATQRLAYEEAVDDPLRLVPHLLDGKGFTGTVGDADVNHRRIPDGKKRLVSRPLITVEADREIFLARGTELTWPDGVAQVWVVDEITNGGKTVTLYRNTGTAPPPGERLIPGVGERVAFTTLTPPGNYRMRLSATPPWTHEPAISTSPGSLEEED